MPCDIPPEDNDEEELKIQKEREEAERNRKLVLPSGYLMGT